jgi:hypothetical protein
VTGICLALCQLFSIPLWLLYARREYKRGYMKGRSEGRSAAEDFIIHLETEVDKARQEIWKEEG